MLLYNSILKINPKYYLPCWYLYIDLIETKDNPEDYYFYNWNYLEDHPLLNEIYIYRNNMENNMDIIINLVEDCVFDITNKYDYYNIDNNEITIDFGLSACIECLHLIDTYGNCSCCS